MARPVLIWGALVLLCVVPVGIAATSPLLAWRSAPYVASGLAGALAMSVLLVQPLVAAGYLPGLTPRGARRAHRLLGLLLIALILVHVAGLYLTSPPDTIDALLLVSPTPFSVYGVVGLWALVATVLLVAARRKMRLAPRIWMATHNAVALVVVVCGVVHALLIEGTMGQWSKWILCAATLIASLSTMLHLRFLKPLARRRRHRNA